MIRNSREREFPTKELVDYGKKLKGASSSRPWSSLKDPRIVRVARSFGGKDRHSKVCTIRGLRDRRVRLSVQTAIQLYDLQDRLGLSQPSKVVDWLLDAAQEDIDKLPPLQMPIENLFQYAQVPLAISHEVPQNQIPPPSSLSYMRFSDGQSLTLMPSKAADQNHDELRADEMRIGVSSNCKLVGKETSCGKSWLERIEEENQEGLETPNTQMIMGHNPMSRPSQSSYPGLVNSFMPYTSYYHWEPSPNPCAPHFGGNGFVSHTEDPYCLNPVAVPSSLSVPTGSQLLVYPSGAMPSIFSSYVPDYDLKPMNHIQMSQPLAPNSVTTSFYPVGSSMRTFQLNKTSKHQSSENDHNQNRSAGEGGSRASNGIPSIFFHNDSKS